MKTEEILEKIGELNDYEIEDFISSLDLTSEQMELLADHENEWVKMGLAINPNLTEELMIKLSDEDWFIRYWLADHLNLTEKVIILLSSDENDIAKSEAFEKFQKLNTLSSDDLESAYDLINNSKHIGRENFKKTFNFIINKFPELSELAEMFKRIILKGKKDLK